MTHITNHSASQVSHIPGGDHGTTSPRRITKTAEAEHLEEAGTQCALWQLAVVGNGSFTSILSHFSLHPACQRTAKSFGFLLLSSSY